MWPIDQILPILAKYRIDTGSTVGLLGPVARPAGFTGISINAVTGQKISLVVQRPGSCCVAVFSMDGRFAANVWNGHLAKGEHEFWWSSGYLAKGVYIVRAGSGKHDAIEKSFVNR